MGLNNFKVIKNTKIYLMQKTYLSITNLLVTYINYIQVISNIS